MNPSEEDSKLLERCMRDRYDNALTRLVYEAGTRCEPFVAAKIPKEYRSLISAEDVAQIARTQAMMKFDQFQGSTYTEFFNWFQRIASNLLTSEVRRLRAKKRGGDRRNSKKAKRPMHELDDLSAHGPSPRNNAERDEAVYAVQANLDKLPTTQRRAIRLHYLESRSIAETAKRLGKSPSRIRQLLLRGIKAMKHALGNSTNWFSR